MHRAQIIIISILRGALIIIIVILLVLFKRTWVVVLFIRYFNLIDYEAIHVLALLGAKLKQIFSCWWICLGGRALINLLGRGVLNLHSFSKSLFLVHVVCFAFSKLVYFLIENILFFSDPNHIKFSFRRQNFKIKALVFRSLNFNLLKNNVLESLTFLLFRSLRLVLG